MFCRKLSKKTLETNGENELGNCAETVDPEKQIEIVDGEVGLKNARLRSSGTAMELRQIGSYLGPNPIGELRTDATLPSQR